MGNKVRSFQREGDEIKRPFHHSEVWKQLGRKYYTHVPTIFLIGWKHCWSYGNNLIGKGVPISSWGCGWKVAYFSEHCLEENYTHMATPNVAQENVASQFEGSVRIACTRVSGDPEVPSYSCEGDKGYREGYWCHEGLSQEKQVVKGETSMTRGNDSGTEANTSSAVRPAQPSDQLSHATAKIRERRQLVNQVSQASCQGDSKLSPFPEVRKERERKNGFELIKYLPNRDCSNLKEAPETAQVGEASLQVLSLLPITYTLCTV